MNKVSNSVILAFTLLLFTFNLVVAQPSIQWEKSYGSIAVDRVFSIQQTADNGFIVVGLSTHASGDVLVNNGLSDYWIVKTDSTGTLEWEKSYGGSEADVAQSVQQTSDGGYIVAGYSQSNDFDVTGHNGSLTISDFWVIKLDNLGNLLWEKSYGGSGFEEANHIEQTNDSGYIICGKSASSDGDVSTYLGGNSDYWIIKIDNLGNIEWENSYGGNGEEVANSVQQTLDGGYIVAGFTTSNNVTGFKGGADYWIIKLDNLGNLIWEKVYGGSGNDGAKSIRQTLSGDFIIAGVSNSMDGDVTGGLGVGLSSVWVVKIDVAGNLVYEKHHNNAGISAFANDVLDITDDGGYVIAGSTSSSGSADYWIIKSDSLANVEWEKPLGGSSTDEAYSIKQTIDGNYIVVGETGSADGDVSFNNGGADYWVVKLNEVVGVEELSNNDDVLIYPNPSNIGMIRIVAESEIKEVKIFNSMGEMVSITQNAQANQLTIDLINQSSGIYFILIKVNEQIITKKIILN